MKLVVLKPQKENSLKGFIEFWSKQYSYPKYEGYYQECIVKKNYTCEDIERLYIWKNGMKLSGPKANGLQNKIISKVEAINTFKKQRKLDVESFLEEFENVSFVWKMFLLHCIKPKVYPIYDQHIHRAYNFLHGDMDFMKRKQHSFYFDFYLPFIKKEDIKDLRKLDKAFFAFGQFLNTRTYKSLLFNE